MCKVTLYIILLRKSRRNPASPCMGFDFELQGFTEGVMGRGGGGVASLVFISDKMHFTVFMMYMYMYDG